MTLPEPLCAQGVEIAAIPDFSSLPTVVEDGLTFEANARKKAEEYSRHVPGEMVVADDSGLEIDALHGAPGVHSARYAADEPTQAEVNTDDEANNARVLRELKNVPSETTNRQICLRAGRSSRRKDARQHFAAPRKESFSKRRGEQMASATIPCFTSRRSTKHSRS